MAAGNFKVRAEGEKQNEDIHREPAPFTARPSPRPEHLLIPLLGLQVGPTDTRELLSTNLILPDLNSEPRGGRGFGRSLCKLGSEMRPLSEG